MNTLLAVLNTAALITLMTIHLMGDGAGDERAKVLTQSTHRLHQVSQVAISNHFAQNQTMLAKDSEEAASVSVDRSERWVF